VFWILRGADWLQGPYFYELYTSKVPASFISLLFVAGFASAALFGPFVGRAADQYGRKKATLAYCILYAMGAASTKCSGLGILVFGRVLSGVGTSIMFCAPESWLVAEFQKSKDDPNGSFLGETFGLVSHEVWEVIDLTTIY
jgi:MFS family permease